jgi:hypothetical protein
VGDYYSSHIDTCWIGSVLLDPAHITGTLADDFIVTLIPLEFDNDVIPAGPILREYVDAAQHSTLDLPTQACKIDSP